ncbi:MAG TPA: hypothetical protein VE573_17635 [Nitrososphaeraceae archaeon]|nr:hypothetical protein [Nitrososphaeraceae archaeon]
METRVNQLTERADMTDKMVKGQEDVTLALKDSKITIWDYGKRQSSFKG